MSKSNYGIEVWEKSAEDRLTPDGKPIRDVRYVADGTLIPISKKDIEVFSGKSPIPVGSSSSSWCKIREPSAVLTRIPGTEEFVLYLCH